MRLSIAAALCCFCTIALAAEPARASIRKDTRIPSEGLSAALETLAKDYDFQVLYRTEVVKDLKTHGASGSLTSDEALTRVLSGTGLTFKYLDAQTVTLIPVAATETAAAADQSRAVPQDSSQGDGKNTSQDFRVAQVDQTNTGPQAITRNQNGPAVAQPPDELQEVVVTAQKREERLIDTPESVSVLSSDELTNLGATQLRDFANTVPGLSFTTAGAGYTQVSLRGVTTGQDTSPTVGIYVDDVPFGSSTGFAQGGQLALDVSLLDIDQVEVLRGPQGTLYGASTMGGLIKYVSKLPDTQSFSGTAQTGVSDTGDGGGVNYNVAAAVNVPLVANVAAVRASVYESHDGGYIDNDVLNEKDVNRSNIYGGRLDFLITPTDGLSIRIDGFLQNINRNGVDAADYTQSGSPIYGSLQQGDPIDQPFSQRFRLVSGTVTYDFGPAIVTSISSYQAMEASVLYDFSSVYVPLLASYGLNYSSVGDAQELDTNKFTQEVRLASHSGQALEWLIGGFFTHEDSTNGQMFVLRDPLGRPALNDLFTLDAPSLFKEYAGFADLTYHFTKSFDVSGGVRYANNSQDYTQNGSGSFVTPAPTSSESSGVTTYLADARYHFSEDATGYLRYATGYRPGGPNFVARDPTTGVLLAPLTFQPDKLSSYEVGFKADFLDRRLGVDVSAYDIDWKNIQVLTSAGGFSVYANAAGATIHGAELSLTARPVSGLTAAINFAYQDAKLNAAAPDVGGADGERLPNVPRSSAALLADYLFSEGNLRPTAGLTLRYVGDRMATFDENTFPQYRLPAYTTFDLRGGVTLGAVQAQLYVHNLFDEHGQLSAYLNSAAAATPTSPGDIPVSILQPRTVGILLSTRF